MKNYKQMITMLIFAGLLGMLSGCGKQTEENQQAEESTVVTTETQADTTEAETETEKNTEAETETTASSSAEEETTTASASGQKSSETTTAISAATETTAENAETTEETTAEEDIPDTQAEQDIPTEPQTDEPDSVTLIPPATEEVTEPDLPDNNSMTITYQGNSLTIGESAKDFVAAVKPNNEESAPSCYGDGENINYYYDDMTVYVWNQNDSYMVYSVDITAPGIVSVSGMDIGSSVTFDGEKRYDMGDNCNIIVLASGGSVVSISYNKDL